MKQKTHSMEGQKTVRIDKRTVICVSISIPDEKAKKDYLEKRERLSMKTESPRWKNQKKKEEEYKSVSEGIQELDISLDINDRSIEEDTEDSEDL